MFIELIDLLRCPVEHEESWLVAAFTKMDGRFVIEGKLGCPICAASYPIAGGVAEFSLSRSPDTPVDRQVMPDDVVRIAALLGLTRAGMTVVIEGDDSVLAPSLVELSEARVITVNASSRIGETERVAAVTAGKRLPLGDKSVDGVVLGTEPLTNNDLAETARVLKPGGRVVAPASMRDPGGARFRELARDERNVVLESIGELVRLSR